MKKVIFIVLVLVGFNLAVIAATPPALINYQGVLRDGTGNPRNGDFDMEFRFYDSPAGTNLLLKDTHNLGAPSGQVAVVNGLFTAQLGAGTITAGSEPNLAEMFRDNADVWLEVQVGIETLIPRVRIVSSAYAQNCGALEGMNASDFLSSSSSGTFLDTSSTPQTKAEKLTLNGATDYGIYATGPTVGGHFENTSPGWTGNSADLATQGYGIHAHGVTAGQFSGTSQGGAFTSSAYGSSAYVAEQYTGIRAYSPVAGGYFSDSDSSGTAYVGYGDRGIEASGTEAGGYFSDSDSSGTAYVGYGNYGIDAHGSSAGGNFIDSDDGAQALVAFDETGIEAYGASAEGKGVLGLGQFAGGIFQDSDSSGYAYVGYGDYGIDARGNYMGGYFADPGSSGYAYAGYGNIGLLGYANSEGGYFEDLDNAVYGRAGYGTYSFAGNGTKSFVQNHPVEKDKVIVYACPEGDEVATYTRGSAKLVDGEARVMLGETFQWVTNPDLGLTAHVTPKSKDGALYVESVSTSELVVRNVKGFPQDATFDYLVYGLRIGFEESSVVQEKQAESYIPSFKEHRERYAKHPELRAYNAMERFKGMETAAGLRTSFDFSASNALRDAVHEYDPATDPPGDQLFGHRGEEAGVKSAGAASPLPPPSPEALQASAGADKTTKHSPDPRRQVSEAPIVSPIGTNLKADFFPVAVAVEPGDVLVMNRANGEELYKCANIADPMVVGIAGEESGEPGLIPVAVSGTTYVKADAVLYPIEKGDLLCASSTPGHAMKAVKPIEAGTVIGKALEPLGNGTGMIKVLVMLR